MNRNPRIKVLSSDDCLADLLASELQYNGFSLCCESCLDTFLGSIYDDPPDLIVVDLRTVSAEVGALIRTIKIDPYFSAIPILGLLAKQPGSVIPWSEFPIDDFVYHPEDLAELSDRIDLSLIRIKRVFDNNPLTRLPGNTSVQNAIAEAIGKPMAVCYLDINNFKPYNDVYGFAHGDEVLRMLGRIMSNAVKESGGGFSGHIGGDDFVFIVPRERAEDVSTHIINRFAAIALDLFDEQEKRNGYYEALNRKGEAERFPLLSIAIAIIPTDAEKIQHSGKVAELAAELKTMAKSSGLSCYVIDKRAG